MHHTHTHTYLVPTKFFFKLILINPRRIIPIIVANIFCLFSYINIYISTKTYLTWSVTATTQPQTCATFYWQNPVSDKFFFCTRLTPSLSLKNAHTLRVIYSCDNVTFTAKAGFFNEIAVQKHAQLSATAKNTEERMSNYSCINNFSDI